MFVFLSAATPWMCPGTVSTNSNTAGLLREIHLASLGMPKWLWRRNSLILSGEPCSSYCYGKSMWLSWRAASTNFSRSLCLFHSLFLRGRHVNCRAIRVVQAAVPQQEEKKKNRILFKLHHLAWNTGQEVCVGSAGVSRLQTEVLWMSLQKLGVSFCCCCWVSASLPSGGNWKWQVS